MTWQTFLFIAVAGTAFGYSGYRFSVLYKLMKAQKGKAKPIDQIGQRIQQVLINVLGQRAVLEKPGIGIAHATIFWGFLIITVGTLEQFASTLYQGASFDFIGEGPYRAFLFMHDLLTFGVLSGVAYAAYRRYIIRPEGLGKSKDATNVLIFTGSLMVSIFFMHGSHIASGAFAYSSSLPFSGVIASLLSAPGFSQGTYETLAIVFKWIHMLLVLGFAVYIPGSKHLHIIAAGPNTFLKVLGRPKGMTPIDFENAEITQYGVAKITDLSWKDTLDYYACTECGRCQDLCPAYNTQKPLSPKALILDLKENLYRHKEKVLAGDYEAIGPVIDENVTEDVIWACTSCRACEIACPVFINHTDKIYDIRRNLVMMESKFPTEVQTVFKNLETNASPWAFAPSDRANWADGLAIKKMAETTVEEIDVLLWVGCAGSYDDRNKKVLTAFASTLKKAGVKFAILGNEEQCTGDPARRIGNEYLYQTLAKANIETLNRYKVKRIVTACPHCLNTIKNEYKDFGGTYDVFHHSEYLAKLISEGKLKPSKTVEDTVTFHDSCYLGRWNNIYDQPRDVLKSIPATRLVEMKQNHDKSLCCGAGGGRVFMEEHIGKRINMVRTEQALDTRAGVIAASCPFCMIMLNDGVKEKEMQDKVKVMDIAELIDQAT